ncbi:MAG: ABC transporter substrate-binding protein [Burkholderiales bacterium]|nr:ABC transporter substrate-binding protein [Burkholderiales bacterium]
MPIEQSKLLLRQTRRLSWREVLVIGLPSVVIAVAGVWFAARFMKPAPPDHITLATGVAGGGYAEFGERYRKRLARDGVRLDLRASAGSVDNWALLRDPKSGVDAALVQSGIANEDDAVGLVALGSVAYEPLWVFCDSDKPIDRLPGLKGKRLAIGVPGSGTRELAKRLIAFNGLDAGQVTEVEIGGTEAAEALLTHRVDCMFIIAAPQAGLLKALIYAPRAEIVNFAQAEAYVRRLHYLTKVTLPEGTIDLEDNIPPRDITLLAATAELVVREDLHPAIQMLLLQAAEEVHGDGDIFHREGDFPSAHRFDLPLSDDAKRYYKSGPPFLQRYLPFWLANFVDRMLVLLIPLVAILFPLFRIVPPLYQWRVRSRIYRWYGELMFIENETRRAMTAGEQRDHEARLDAIETLVNDLEPPLAYADQFYALRTHIDFVRDKLAKATLTAAG